MVNYDPKNNGKLVPSYDDLIQKVQALKVLGKVIVFLSGTWDLLHVGHCRYFRSAVLAAAEATGRSKQDVILIVGVDNDKEVKSRKGDFRPIVPEDERSEILEYLEDISYVVLKTEKEQSWALVELIGPDFLILSETTQFINEEAKEAMLQKLKQWAKDVIMLPPQAPTSTTGKIRTLITGAFVNARQKFDSFVDEFHSLMDELGGR
jgi:bifunctional ADP-heptose synthase (sugar kinase/adenylyltransferase)